MRKTNTYEIHYQLDDEKDIVHVDEIKAIDKYVASKKFYEKYKKINAEILSINTLDLPF